MSLLILTILRIRAQKIWKRFPKARVVSSATFGLLTAATASAADQLSAEPLYVPTAAFLTAAATEIVSGFKTVSEERQSEQRSPLTLDERGRLRDLVKMLRRQLDLLSQRGVISEDFYKSQLNGLVEFQQIVEQTYETTPAQWENIRTYMEYLELIDSLVEVRVRLLDIVSELRSQLGKIREIREKELNLLEEAEELAKTYEGTAEQERERARISHELRYNVIDVRDNLWNAYHLEYEQRQELKTRFQELETRLRELDEAASQYQRLFLEHQSLRSLRAA
jgi:hypothetical protein